MAIFIPATDKKGREISYNSKEVMKKVLVYINTVSYTHLTLPTILLV